MKLSQAEIDELLANAHRNGLSYTVRGVGGDLLTATAPTVQPVAPTEPEAEAPQLLPCVFNGFDTWVLGLETRSETNQRDWKKKSGRTQSARRAVSRLLGRNLLELSLFANHYHRGGVVRLVFTRLAKRTLDRSNLPASMKAVEDAVSLMLGADDGDARWRSEFEQEKSERMGVRVKLECVA